MDGTFMTRMSNLLNGLQAGRCLICAAVVASLMSVGSVLAKDADASSDLVSRYSDRIVSVEMAERALAEVSKERSGIEERFAADERTCYADFFATSCIEKARERRRHALAEMRKVEVKANAFLRQARVNDRDKALEEKRLEQERKEAEQLKREQANGQADKTKAGMRENSRETPRETPREPVREPVPARASPRSGEANQRQAQHEAKLKRLEEQERADAQKRADNVAAYERKAREAQERQREVAAKKREKERERASRAPLN
jgi:colicin import membrane protein